MSDSGTGMSSAASTNNNGSDSKDSETSSIQTVVKIQAQNNCAWCSAPCVVLTTSDHHCLSMEELSLWALMIVCSSLRLDKNIF